MSTEKATTIITKKMTAQRDCTMPNTKTKKKTEKRGSSAVMTTTNALPKMNTTTSTIRIVIVTNNNLRKSMKDKHLEVVITRKAAEGMPEDSAEVETEVHQEATTTPKEEVNPERHALTTISREKGQFTSCTTNTEVEPVAKSDITTIPIFRTEERTTIWMHLHH